jgi:hypothetical protein
LGYSNDGAADGDACFTGIALSNPDDRVGVGNMPRGRHVDIIQPGQIKKLHTAHSDLVAVGIKWPVDEHISGTGAPVPFFPGFVQFAFKNDKEVSRDVAVAAINAAPSQALPGSWLPSEIGSGHCIVTLQNRPA